KAIPEDLEALTARLLAKNDEERPQTATEVRDALAAILAGRGERESVVPVAPKTLSSAPSAVREVDRRETAPSRPFAVESERALGSGMTFAGRYLLEARIGVGGMGELFRAFDTRLRRTVALKVLHRERALHAPTESSARILREARAAAALSHANVVAIHDVG